MLTVLIFSILFTLVTVISILLMGSRELIGGEMTIGHIFRMLINWRFLLGAFFAFFARLFFILINAKLYKIPQFSNTSTTITAMITSSAMIFVVLANYYFLGEKINFLQGIGIFAVLFGIFLLTK
jgi:drug/metabolite transporter (DMT)-like permease